MLRYSFDEASSGTNTVLDTSGVTNQSNGTFFGTGTRTSNTPGGFGVAAFDAGTGGGGYIDAGDVDKLDGLSKITITFWLRLYGPPANGQFVLTKQDAGNVNGYEVLYGLPSGGAGVLGATNFAVKLRLGTLTASAVSADLNADNAWIFVAITYDGTATSSNLRFYNGGPSTPIGAATVRNYNAGIPPVTTAPFRICASAAGPATISAMMDDVRIYANVLGSAQLELIRQANLPPTLWWDRNGSAAGSTNGPGGVANGVWSSSSVWTPNNNWNSSPGGDFVSQQWSEGSIARFAASNDATGSYVVTVSNTPTANAIYIEEGNVQFNRNSMILGGSGLIDVVGGSTATFDTTAIGGGVGLTKTNGGTLILGGVNTYTGTTALNGGTTLVNGSIVSAAVNVSSNCTLGGKGTIAGQVVVANGATVSPGASAGLLTIQNGLDLSAGGTYFWELATNSTATAGSDFDQIAVTGGNLTLGAASKLSINFTGTATTPTGSDPFWQTAQSWTIVSLAGGSNPGGSNFGSLSNATYAAGSFSTATNGSGEIVLTFTPSASAPVFATPVLSGGTVTFSWSANNGSSYEVQYNTNLLTTNWFVLTNVTATGSTAAANDTTSGNPQRYYRVILLP